jgi:hypothetical protein
MVFLCRQFVPTALSARINQSRFEPTNRGSSLKIFTCPSCEQLLTFESTSCLGCGAALGYDPDTAEMVANPTSRLCTNAPDIACNWLVAQENADEEHARCRACSLNRTIPDLTVAGNRERWARLEQAKRRLVYSLLRMGLQVLPKTEDSDTGLSFDFLASTKARSVLTGHESGLITLNIAEADDVARERARTQMGEPYRTLLGHFRHESGHYYWDRCIQGTAQLERFREVFGDERDDYGAALERHHAQGAPADWPSAFVSAYATCHPWEDFAETWAHYLHIVDTLETAGAYGLRVSPRHTTDPSLRATPSADSYRLSDFDTLVEQWLPVTYAVNAINRSMGHNDLYPFTLSPPAMEKLRFVHDVVRNAT